MARTNYVDRLQKSDDDYISSFEQAARRNFIDAESLRLRSRRLGAIYLYGYSVEMRVKAAYFRMVFAAAPPPGGMATKTNDERKKAEKEKDLQGNLFVKNHHDISGWANLLVTRRASLAATNQAVTYTPALATDIRNRADRVYDYWKEYMRYRVFTVYADELDSVRADADWFRLNYQHL